MGPNKVKNLMNFWPDGMAYMMESRMWWRFISKHIFAGRQIAHHVFVELRGARTSLFFGSMTAGSNCMKAALEIHAETPR